MKVNLSTNKSTAHDKLAPSFSSVQVQMEGSASLMMSHTVESPPPYASAEEEEEACMFFTAAWVRPLP
jgi:hypothetical protein